MQRCSSARDDPQTSFGDGDGGALVKSGIGVGETVVRSRRRLGRLADRYIRYVSTDSVLTYHTGTYYLPSENAAGKKQNGCKA